MQRSLIAGRRRPLRSAVLAGTLAVLAALVGLASGTAASTASAASPKSAVDLSGVTLSVADLFKQYQTAFAATGTLQGAPYQVSWSQFTSGPPIVAAETGGSVDLGPMAETPTIFAQAANDPIKVVAVTKGANPKLSPLAVVVPKGSPITKVSQLRGHTIAVQEGTVEQYLLVQILKKAGIPTSAVTIDNLPITSGSTAVTSGKVDAAVLSQPLTGLDVHAGTVTQLVSGARYVQTLEYLAASRSALDNPKKSAAIADFINRFYKAMAMLRKNPSLAAQTYVKTYGVPLAVAKVAAASVQAVGTPVTPALIAYQQAEANTFQGLGLIPKRLKVNAIFDLPFNKRVSAAAGLQP